MSKGIFDKEEDDDSVNNDPVLSSDDSKEEEKDQWVPESRYSKGPSKKLVLGVIGALVVAGILMVNVIAGISYSAANTTLNSFNKATERLHEISVAKSTVEQLSETYDSSNDKTVKNNVGHARQVVEAIAKSGEFKPLEKGLEAEESAKRVTLYFSLCDLISEVPTTNTNITTINLVESCQTYKNRVEDLINKFDNYSFAQNFKYIVPPFVAPLGTNMPALFYKG